MFRKLRLVDQWSTRHSADVSNRQLEVYRLVEFLVDHPIICLPALKLTELILEGSASGALSNSDLAELCEVLDEVLKCPEQS